MTPSQYQAKVKAAQSAYDRAISQLNAAIRDLNQLGITVTFNRR
jgi:hypothetical protein